MKWYINIIYYVDFIPKISNKYIYVDFIYKLQFRNALKLKNWNVWNDTEYGTTF